jgi:hypothetical protein
MTSTPVNEQPQIRAKSGHSRGRRFVDDRIKYLTLQLLSLWRSDMRGVLSHVLGIAVESAFLLLHCILLWLTVCSRCILAVVTFFPSFKALSSHLVSLILVGVMGVILKSGFVTSIAMVKRTSHKVAKSASDLVLDSSDPRTTLILDVAHWDDPESFIRSILALSESGFTLTGTTNPRYCFFNSDPSRSNPWILLIALLVSCAAVLRHCIACKNLPRHFPLFQDVPTSKISSIEEVSQ